MHEGFGSALVVLVFGDGTIATILLHQLLEYDTSNYTHTHTPSLSFSFQQALTGTITSHASVDHFLAAGSFMRFCISQTEFWKIFRLSLTTHTADSTISQEVWCAGRCLNMRLNLLPLDDKSKRPAARSIQI